MIKSIIDHIVSIYGFRIISDKAPANKYEEIKKRIYYYFKKHKPIFIFLNRIYPIKYSADIKSLHNVNQRSIWLRKMEYNFNEDSRSPDEIDYFEIEIRHISPEHSIYVPDTKKMFIPESKNNYIICMYYSRTDNFIKFSINSNLSIIDAYFSDYPSLNRCIRNFKIESIF